MYANRVWMTTATAGTGTITLGSAKAGYLTPAEAGVANADTVTYCIIDGNDFELGTGTYTTSGTTLSRDTVTVSKISGTAGTTKLTLSGSAEVFFTNDQNKRWDGSFNGYFVPQDAYVWELQFKLPEGDQLYRGHVTILR
jgi:hypothetical protein